MSALDTRALSSLRCRRSSPLVEDFRRSSVSRVRRVECRALCRPSARVDGSSGASRAGPRPVESRADAREDACEACARLRVSRAIKLMRVEVRGGSPRRKTSSVLCLECLRRNSSRLRLRMRKRGAEEVLAAVSRLVLAFRAREAAFAVPALGLSLGLSLNGSALREEALEAFGLAKVGLDCFASPECLLRDRRRDSSWLLFAHAVLAVASEAPWRPSGSGSRSLSGFSDISSAGSGFRRVTRPPGSSSVMLKHTEGANCSSCLSKKGSRGPISLSSLLIKESQARNSADSEPSTASADLFLAKSRRTESSSGDEDVLQTTQIGRAHV